MEITLVILLVAIILFLTEKLSADLVALLVALSLGISGVLSFEETFAGFSRPAVITIMAIFILAEGLRQSGVTAWIGGQLLKVGGKNENTLLIFVMIFSALLSLIMNNIAVAAVLLPAVIGAADRAKVSPSRLLIPLAYATMLGGMATLLTSTNIVASSLLIEEGMQGYSLVDFAPLGLPVAILGLIFIFFVSRKLLKENSSTIPSAPGIDLVDTYHLEERLVRVKLPPGSELEGKHISGSGLREVYCLNLVAIERKGSIILSPPPDYLIQPADILLLEGKVHEIEWQQLAEMFEVLPARDLGEDDLESPDIAVSEVVLSPRSALIGKTLTETHFREKYGMLVLGIWRSGRPIRSGLSNEKLIFGDALLIQGSKKRLKILLSDPDMILLQPKDGMPEVNGKNRLWAGIIFLSAIILSIIFPDAIAPILLLAGMVMVLTGLLRMEQAYRAIEWKSIFIIAGMLPMGIAISKTGLAALIADWLMQTGKAAPPYLTLIFLFIITVFLSQVVHGAVIAAIMVPICIKLALSLGLDPRSAVMAIALATSMTFITPLGHPVSILVMAPGGYHFKDYVKVGLPLALFVGSIILILLPLIWPL